MEDFQAQCRFHEQDIFEIEQHLVDDEMLTVSVREGRLTASVGIYKADATRLRDWLTRWLDQQGATST